MLSNLQGLLQVKLDTGQICLAPDYVLLPENKLDKFIMHAKETVSTMFPSIKDNDDYTSVINERHYSRLKSYIDEAKKIMDVKL